jgi:hypothetical protein
MIFACVVGSIGGISDTYIGIGKQLYPLVTSHVGVSNPMSAGRSSSPVGTGHSCAIYKSPNAGFSQRSFPIGSNCSQVSSFVSYVIRHKRRPIRNNKCAECCRPFGRVALWTSPEHTQPPKLVWGSLDIQHHTVSHRL